MSQIRRQIDRSAAIRIGALARISLKHSQFTEIGGLMVPAHEGARLFALFVLPMRFLLPSALLPPTQGLTVRDIFAHSTAARPCSGRAQL
jgi:hypothetical protein